MANFTSYEQLDMFVSEAPVGDDRIEWLRRRVAMTAKSDVPLVRSYLESLEREGQIAKGHGRARVHAASNDRG